MAGPRYRRASPIAGGQPAISGGPAADAAAGRNRRQIDMTIANAVAGAAGRDPLKIYIRYLTRLVSRSRLRQV